MALPGNLTTITVTGQYIDVQGNAIAGQVLFTAQTILVSASANQFIMPRTITVDLDGNGEFSTTIPTTNDPDVFPNGWTYKVEEAFSGGRTYYVELPANLAPTVDLTTLAPALSSPETVYSYVLLDSVGAPTGVASLDSSGFVPLTQLSGITAAKISSGAATVGYVLTANGSGGVSWQAVTTGASPFLALMVMGG